MAPSSPIFVKVYADQACTKAPDVNQTYTKLYAKITGDVGHERSFIVGPGFSHSQNLRFYTPDASIGRTYYRIMLYNRYDSGEITTELHDGSVVELSASQGLAFPAFYRLEFSNRETEMSDITFSQDRAGYVSLKYGSKYPMIYAHVWRPVWVYKNMTNNSAIITTTGDAQDGRVVCQTGQVHIRITTDEQKEFHGSISAEYDESGKYAVLQPQTIPLQISGSEGSLKWSYQQSTKFQVYANIYKLLNS